MEKEPKVSPYSSTHIARQEETIIPFRLMNTLEKQY